MSLNKQFVLGESTTKEQGIDEMSSFVHAFYNVTSSVLQEKEKKHSPSLQAILREGFKYTYRTRQSRGRSQGCWDAERTLGMRLIVFAHEVTAAILVFQNSKMAAMLMYQTNSVGVELFSCAIALVCSNNFAWLLAREWPSPRMLLSFATCTCSAQRGIIIAQISCRNSDCSRQWIGGCQSNGLMREVKSQDVIKLTKGTKLKAACAFNKDFCQQSRVQRHSLLLFLLKYHTRNSLSAGAKRFPRKKFFF